MLFKIALRNILRNPRRSGMTISAIAMGGVALLLFGAFVARVILGFQTMTVQRTGHLSVFHSGYVDFGGGNPAAYGIADYRNVMELIRTDPVVGPMLSVITPTVYLFGVAGNFDADASKTFMGVGMIGADRDRMRFWDEYGLVTDFWLRYAQQGSGLDDRDQTQGVVGTGLARILGLCDRLGLKDCPPLPPRAAERPAPGAPPLPSDLAELAAKDLPASQGPATPAMPRVDLLAATAGGAPNVVSLYIRRAAYMGFKELDDAYVGMPLALAQQLLYGRGEHKVTSIVLQLHRTEDLAAARARLGQLFKDHGLDLEVRDFVELTPMYKQSLGMFVSIFSFIAVIMGVIVLFTVVNTMSMSVMERTNEIGTTRAMGLRRSAIRRQFVVEGALLGVIGATTGVILAAILAFVINRSGLMWTPPGQVEPIPLLVMLAGNWFLMVGTWVGLVVMATLAALIPANRAARMPVVDALRHV